MSCLTKHLTNSIEITEREGRASVCVLAWSYDAWLLLLIQSWVRNAVRESQSSFPFFFLWSSHLSLSLSVIFLQHFVLGHLEILKKKWNKNKIRPVSVSLIHLTLLRWNHKYSCAIKDDFSLCSCVCAHMCFLKAPCLVKIVELCSTEAFNSIFFQKTSQ